MKDAAEIMLDNVFSRPLSVPRPAGFFSAILVFVLVLQMILRALPCAPWQNDVLSNSCVPPSSLRFDYPAIWAPESQDLELSMPHGCALMSL